MNKIHIGELIKAQVEKCNLSNAEFGRRINATGANVRDIYKRQSINTDQLLTIGEVLEHDFFKYFSPQTVEKPIKADKKPSNKIKVMVELEFDKDDLLKQIKGKL